MKNNTHISWWSANVPDLSNWLPDQFKRLNRQQQAELSKSPSKLFVDEIGDDLDPNFVLNSTALANRVDQRILQLHGNGINKIWYITLAVLFIGIIASLFFNKSSHSDDDNSIVHAPGLTKQVEKQLPDSPEKMKQLTTLSKEKSEKKDDVIGPIIETKDQIISENNDLDASSSIVDPDKQEEVIADLTKQQVVIDEKKTEEKKTKPLGYKIVDGNQTKKAKRDATMPLKIQKVSIEHLDNYANHLNAPKISSKITHGELEQKNQDANKHIKFAPADIPSYSGGNERLEEHLKLNLSRVVLTKKYDHPVSVMASFVVNPKGQLENIKIYGSETAEIKKASIKALQDLDPFQKGKKSGKKGSAYYEIMFSFN